MALKDIDLSGAEETLSDSAARTIPLLEQMLVKLNAVLDDRHSWPSVEQPMHFQLQEPDGRQHRVIVLDVAALSRNSEMFVVGFFGIKRLEVDRADLVAADNDLVAELPLHRHIAAYCTMQLDAVDHANMVLMTGPEAVAELRASARHAAAVRDVAPRQYDTVTIQNLLLEAGWRTKGRFRLLQTKFYDYRTAGT